MEMERLRLWILAHAFLLSVAQGAIVGFNYGIQLSERPSPERLLTLLKAQHITNIRLYDTDPALLKALAGSGIQVMLTLPNNQLLSVSQSNATAANWISANVVAYLPETNITAICVGTQVLTTSANVAPILLPAMELLYTALTVAGLSNQVKLSTSHSSELILDSFPPSQAFFNRTWAPVFLPLLSFLSDTDSSFMLDFDIYDIYKGSGDSILLDYALLNPLRPGEQVVDANTLLSYSNLFDALIDSAFFAIAQLNYTNISIVVSETGWPSQGDSTDTQATPENASTYISNLIRHIANDSGTPKQPRATIGAYISSLFDEDLKPGLATVKHYGLFNSTTMEPVYLLPLSGSGTLLANDTTRQLYCVASPEASRDELQIALDWACGPGRANCSGIQPGDLCYEPDTIQAHASFAFNSFFQMAGEADGSCDFNGVAIITTTDPSYGACVYPVSNSNTTSNSTTTSAGSGTSPNTTSINNMTSSLAPSPSATSTAYYAEVTHLHIVFTLSSLFLILGIVSLL